MHLPAEGIDRAEMAGGVGEELDVPLADAEQPGLGIVRIAREDRGGDEAERALVTAAAPVAPGLERRPRVEVPEHALRPRPPAQPAGGQDDRAPGGTAGSPEEASTAERPREGSHPVTSPLPVVSLRPRVSSGHPAPGAESPDWRIVSAGCRRAAAYPGRLSAEAAAACSKARPLRRMSRSWR